MHTLDDHVKLHTEVLTKVSFTRIPLLIWTRVNTYTNKITQLSNYLESVDPETLTEEQKKALDSAFERMQIYANQLDTSIKNLTNSLAIERYGKMGVYNRFADAVFNYWHACKGELLNYFFEEFFKNELSW